MGHCQGRGREVPICTDMKVGAGAERAHGSLADEGGRGRKEERQAFAKAPEMGLTCFESYLKPVLKMSRNTSMASSGLSMKAVHRQTLSCLLVEGLITVAAVPWPLRVILCPSSRLPSHYNSVPQSHCSLAVKGPFHSRLSLVRPHTVL